MPTASAMGKTYCPQCGWNREEAEKQTRLLLRLLPVLVILFDAPLIIWIFVGHAEVPVLGALGALAIVPAILVVLVVKGKVRIGTTGGGGALPAQPAPAVALQGGTTSITAPSEEIAEQYKVLAELPRPRPVRLSRQGKMNILIVSIAWLMFAGVLVAVAVLRPVTSRGNITPPNPLVYIVPAGLLALITYATRRALVQQRQLLSLGTLAMGRVTKQWIARSGNGIRYEFITPTGETISRMTIDNARQVLAGMTIPIFYDARHPKKQVALCASFYEVNLPGQE